MRIGVVGINHKLADLALRERLAKACQRRFSSGSSMHGTHAFVLLSTCNRTEVYFCSDDLTNTHSYLLAILRNDVDQEFDQKLYSYFGYDCFMHLSRVTSGLDSAIVAETEIQGQVKTAYENACTFKTLPFDMHYLFQKALKIGKQVRSSLPQKPGLPDMEHAILHTGLQLFEKPSEVKILFVGASEINIKVIAFLKMRQCHNITLCNRSTEPAQALAERYQLDLLDWPRLNDWANYDWIIFGTKSPDYLIKKEHTNNGLVKRKLIMDLCVPRNVDPSLGKDERITLLNIDQINRSLKIRRQRMNESLVKAEHIVTEATRLHVQLFHQRGLNPLRIVAATA